MNRYTAQGIVDDAISGKHVLVIAPTESDAKRFFDDLRGLLAEGDVRGSTRGGGLYDMNLTSGASIRVRNYQSAGYRGVSVDVVVIDPAVMAPAGFVDSLAPCLACSRCGELIYG